MRDTIRFIRKGRMVELGDIAPTALLLDYLREVEGATGTKEGCGEGDCGACTVALGRVRDGKLTYEPVNACIQLLGQVDGCEVVAVEDLADRDGELHPVQAAMHDAHASQCGFCTPGFVMSLFTLYHSDKRPATRAAVNDWIAGNLCRCTGYRPIVDAAVKVCGEAATDRFAANAADTTGLIGFLADTDDVFIGDSDRFFASPASLESLADLYEQHPDATIVAGATDVGLWITKQFRDLPKIIHIGRARGLDHIGDTGYELLIGAAATYAQIEPYFRVARSRSRRIAAPARLEAGPRQRHHGRQRRQRLADRRHAAGADRARSHGRTSQGQAGAEHAAGGLSSSTTASRTASRASWSSACSCRR